MLYQSVKEQLQQLGFSDKEAEVYLTLNKYGSMPAATLSRLTKVNRTSVYDVVAKLQERNLVISFQQGKTVFFAIDDVNKLHVEEKRRLTVAETLVASLRADQQATMTDITYYKGQEGVRELYEDILESGAPELRVWVDLDAFYSVVDPGYDESWTQQRIQQGMTARIFAYTGDAQVKFQGEDAQKLRETRPFNASGAFQAATFLYDGHVCFFDASNSITGVRISNGPIYTMMAEAFDLAWNARSNG